MRWFGSAVFLISLSISSAAYSRDVKVENSTTSVSPPAGFCEVDKTKQFDSSWLTSVTNLMNSSGIYVIAAFPDCRELKQGRQSNQFIETKVYITAPLSLIGKASPQSVTETCKELRTTEYTDKGKAETAKAVKEFANGNSSVDSKMLGVLEETADQVCYVATLQKVKTKAGDIKTMLSLFAVTYAHNNLLFLYQFTPYVDATSMSTALANLKIIYSDFAAANK